MGSEMCIRDSSLSPSLSLSVEEGGWLKCLAECNFGSKPDCRPSAVCLSTRLLLYLALFLSLSLALPLPPSIYLSPSVSISVYLCLTLSIHHCVPVSMSLGLVILQIVGNKDRARLPARRQQPLCIIQALTGISPPDLHSESVNLLPTLHPPHFHQPPPSPTNRPRDVDAETQRGMQRE